MSELSDAIAVTGATTGQNVLSVELTLANLTQQQRAALATFVGTLGWPYNTSHIRSISLARAPGPNAPIFCSVEGYRVIAADAAAITAHTAGQGVLLGKA